DYFRENFEKVNEQNFKASMLASFANGILSPIYTFGSQIAQTMVLFYGIFLITQDELTVGLLFSFITYANDFYNPLREIASLFASFQRSVAAWTRINELLTLRSDIKTIEDNTKNVDEG